jgi:hypothetical protein
VLGHFQFKSGQFPVENWTPILGSLNTLQEGTMDQVHTRFSDEQVVFVLRKYCQGLMTRVEVQEVLGVAKTGFFAVWREYRRNPSLPPDGFRVHP